MIPPGTPFGDGFNDGLMGRADYAHLYPEGRAREKYLEGVVLGAKDRADGALEPVERLG